MLRTKPSSRAEPNEDGGPIEAPSQIGKEKAEPTKQNADHQAVLAAIASLQVDLSKAKSDICDKIAEKIADVSTILRGEMAILKADNDNAFIAVHARIDIAKTTHWKIWASWLMLLQMLLWISKLKLRNWIAK